MLTIISFDNIHIMTDMPSGEYARYYSLSPPKVPLKSTWKGMPDIKPFNSTGAWKIREQVLAKDQSPLAPTSPSMFPKVDTYTKYEPGKERYIVESTPIVSGMGALYRGWDMVMGRYVAVKTLDSFVLHDPNLKHTLELEAKSIAKISHKGIPDVYDFLVAEDADHEKVPMMIMQFVEGEDLSHRIEFGKPLLKHEIVRVASEVAETIDYMAGKGLHHGDIKPGNILLSQPFTKVVDFGINNWVASVTDRMPKTPGYSPPELYQLDGKPTLQSDEFMLGVTLYRMLGGDEAFTWDGLKDFSYKQLSYDGRYKISLSMPTIDRLNDVFGKALSFNPKERYQTATELASAFIKALGN